MEKGIAFAVSQTKSGAPVLKETTESIELAFAFDSRRAAITARQATLGMLFRR